MARKKKRSFHLKDHIVQILLVIIVVWLLAMLLINQVRVGLIRTEKVSSMVLEDVDAGYGLLKGGETYVIAPADGAVEPVVTEGNRVRKGNAVFRVGDQIAYTNFAGLVSYELDGLEGVEDLSTVCATDLAARYEAQQAEPEAESPAEQDTEAEQEPLSTEAVAGEAYAKVIDNLGDIFLYISVPRTEYTASLEVGGSFPVRLADLDYEVQATLVDAADAAGGERYLKAKLTDVREQAFAQRLYAVELPYNRMTAIAIPVEALIERDGVQGVYYLQKGFAFWQPVTVSQVRESDGLAVISEGLESGALIVTTPGLVHEGENIKF